VALIAAPLLNRDTPWWDYETWAADTSASKSTSFTWDHSYDGLNWPRDGRELLRVAAKQPAYWKAENLDVFDGEHWLRSRVGSPGPEAPDGEPQVVKRWTQKIRVSIRNLRTDQFITAGSASQVSIPKLIDIPTLDGLYVSPRTLRRGDTYTATVYTPHPSENQLRRAGTDYESQLSAYTTIYTSTIAIPGPRPTRLPSPSLRQNPPHARSAPPVNDPFAAVLAKGKLTRPYGLARELMDGARTPEDYVERVLNYLGDTAVYTYSETP